MTNALARVCALGTGEVLLFGMTPPPRDQLPSKIAGAAERARARLSRLDVDAVAVYDLVDEPGRSDAPRPFPFTPTLAPADYARTHLRGTAVPVVQYRSTGTTGEAEHRDWMAALPHGALAVLVGTGSSSDRPALPLPDAQEMLRRERPDVLLGAVTIPERHLAKGDEHERILEKQASGCSFFVSQVVYDAAPARRLIRDYTDAVRQTGRRPAPIVFSLTLCGSQTQLDLLEWLGVAVPPAVAEDLRRSEDPRTASYRHVLDVAADVAATCRGLGQPFGFLVESLSDLRADADAAVELTRDIAGLLRR